MVAELIKQQLFYRFLATGESYRSLSFSHRIGVATISAIIPRANEAIWQVMKGDYIKMPSTNEELKKIAERFEKRWNFPHCVGVIDGIHVVMRCHKKSGSLNFNYKGTFQLF